MMEERQESDVFALLKQILDQLAGIVARLDRLEQGQKLSVVKEWYTTEEIAKRVCQATIVSAFR